MVPQITAPETMTQEQARAWQAVHNTGDASHATKKGMTTAEGKRDYVQYLKLRAQDEINGHGPTPEYHSSAEAAAAQSFSTKELQTAKADYESAKTGKHPGGPSYNQYGQYAKLTKDFVPKKANPFKKWGKVAQKIAKGDYKSYRDFYMKHSKEIQDAVANRNKKAHTYWTSQEYKTKAYIKSRGGYKKYFKEHKHLIQGIMKSKEVGVKDKVKPKASVKYPMQRYEHRVKKGAQQEKKMEKLREHTRLQHAWNMAADGENKKVSGDWKTAHRQMEKLKKKQAVSDAVYKKLQAKYAQAAKAAKKMRSMNQHEKHSMKMTDYRFHKGPAPDDCVEGDQRLVCQQRPGCPEIKCPILTCPKGQYAVYKWHQVVGTVGKCRDCFQCANIWTPKAVDETLVASATKARASAQPIKVVKLDKVVAQREHSLRQALQQTLAQARAQYKHAKAAAMKQYLKKKRSLKLIEPQLVAQARSAAKKEAAAKKAAELAAVAKKAKADEEHYAQLKDKYLAAQQRAQTHMDLLNPVGSFAESLKSAVKKRVNRIKQKQQALLHASYPAKPSKALKAQTDLAQLKVKTSKEELQMREKLLKQQQVVMEQSKKSMTEIEKAHAKEVHAKSLVLKTRRALESY